MKKNIILELKNEKSIKVRSDLITLTELEKLDIINWYYE